MTLAAQTAPAGSLTLSDAAVARLKALQEAKQEPGLLLRVSVSSGGCQGFSLNFSLTDERFDSDHVIDRDGARVVVDADSLALLDGAEIDFTDTLMSQSFIVRNPHATSTCGCGSSFSL
ncbi:HesB/IscA family protein [Pararhodospirillum photometricum]|uniref:HesB/YadR/YfhF n=1 Tax=Pararhodospirillum photometricum DSM 122 TaxID=1150469 RepID=H6SQB4_PARPM|nr:iron-sulfur cluster assembly accessory protein [Pararhodospirillum photometricum]CCG09633.1 HesB/YadR/YfhF [Pararhodospirillum photometricum DSM 122]